MTQVVDARLSEAAGWASAQDILLLEHPAMMRQSLWAKRGVIVIGVHPQLFLLNRMLSFPDDRVQTRRAGLLAFGGISAAVETAWNVMQHWWAFASHRNRLRLNLARTRDGSVYKVVEALASALLIDVEIERGSAINACLIRTKRGASIYLNGGLSLRQRSFYVLHELAHEWLDHEPANHVLTDPTPERLARHRYREQQADASAETMLHVTDGLIDLWQPQHRRNRWAESQTEESREMRAASTA